MEGTGRDSVTPPPSISETSFSCKQPRLWVAHPSVETRTRHRHWEKFCPVTNKTPRVSSRTATRKGWKSRTNLYFIHFPFPSCSQIWLKAFSQWKAAAQGGCRAIAFLSLGGFPSLDCAGVYGAQFIISIFYKHLSRKMPLRWIWLFCNHWFSFVHRSSVWTKCQKLPDSIIFHTKLE